jgi:hypothetical protein
MRKSRDPSLSKPQSNDDDNDNNDNDKDTVIASTSKNHDDHNIIFFVPVVVVVAAVDYGGTCPCGHLLTLTPLRVSCQCARKRRGGDPLWLKPRSHNNNADDDNNNNIKDFCDCQHKHE